VRRTAALTFVTLLASAAAYGSPEEARAILEQNCIGCHGAAQMSGLDLRTREGALSGGKRGTSIVPGHPEQSLLHQVLSGDHEVKMPAGKPALATEQVETLAAWIREGAQWEGELAANVGETWWSFEKPTRPAPPTSSVKAIDAFIFTELEERGLEPLPAADRRTLIRRAYFDLHGLPPSPEAVERFVEAESPDAYAKLIDELLESPRYGERWGRHWLDVVRYADSGGFETDIYFPNAWRYRDYVIESFNKDKPFDRFVREQIAGDEIWPDDIELRGGYQIPKEKLEHLEARIGTGMYAIGPVYHEAALDGRQLRYEWMTDAVDTTGAAFLGLTVGCARCHDHKFDPLSQRDYHRMLAIFAGSEPRNIPVVNKMSEFGYYTGYPKQLKVQEYQEAIKRIDVAARQRITSKIEEKFSEEVRAAHAKPNGERTSPERELAATLEKALTEAGLKENAVGKTARIEYSPHEKDERERLIYQLGEAALKARFELAQATVLGRSDVVYPTQMTSRGDFHGIGDEVEAGFPAALTGGREPSVVKERRKALAEWLASPDHPLTARVMVNRIWQGHFGRGIVATPNDFGRQGGPPTHPELLDWLAVEFVEQGWSVKTMHRLIMLSDVYRRASSPHEANSAIDAENRFLWRMNRRRLEAETLRDSVLAVSGDLNLKAGGRPVVPPLSEDEMRGMWAPDQWPVALDPEEHNRRSVYIYVKRSFPFPMFTTFDAPDSSVSCARRDVTTVAPQALAMINSEFMLARAKSIAKRVAEKYGPEPERRVEGVWLLALGRRPSADETARAAALLDKGEESLAQLGLLAFNLNEFLYVD